MQIDTCRTSEAETTTRTGQRTTASDDLEPRGMTQRRDITPGDHVRTFHFHACVKTQPKSVTSHHPHFCDDFGRGPALGGQDLTKSSARQICAPSRTDNADVRPRLSDQRRPSERNERRGTVKERRSELLALKQEVEVRRVQLLRHRSGA